jgi:hypothetical protein
LTLSRLRYGPAMTPDYRLNLVRSFERHLRAENRSEHTIASYLDSLRQAEAVLAGRGRTLVDARPRWPGTCLICPAGADTGTASSDEDAGKLPVCCLVCSVPPV